MRAAIFAAIFAVFLSIQPSVSAETNVPVIDSLLPLKNSFERNPGDKISHIVIHFSSNVKAKPENPYIANDVIGIYRRIGVSAHYLIVRNGAIYRLVDEARIAKHVGRGMLLNFPAYRNDFARHSIGIELLGIGTESEMFQYISSEISRGLPKSFIGFTDAEYSSLRLLLREICRRYGIPFDRNHIIGHNEYNRRNKTDPGALFEWRRLGLDDK